jgi:hypothetical protein
MFNERTGKWLARDGDDIWPFTHKQDAETFTENPDVHPVERLLVQLDQSLFHQDQWFFWCAECQQFCISTDLNDCDNMVFASTHFGDAWYQWRKRTC